MFHCIQNHVIDIWYTSTYTCKLNNLFLGLAKKKTPSVATQLALLGKDESKLSCPHCDFVCYRVQNFTRHLRSHEKPEFYKCDLCEYTHKNKGEVRIGRFGVIFTDIFIVVWPCPEFAWHIWWFFFVRLRDTSGTLTLRKITLVLTVDLFTETRSFSGLISN